MKILLSWSGAKSEAVAEILRDWLPDVIQSLEPWMSSRDIAAGQRWSRELDEQLAACRFGIIVLTAENQSAPWIMFEAGALAKTIKDTFVCPYLVDLSIPSMLPSPLTHFQAKEADKAGTGELLRAINRARGEDALSEERLARAFERSWPDLEEKLRVVRNTEVMASARRPTEDAVEEILLIARELSREGAPISSLGPMNWYEYGISVGKLGNSRVRLPGAQVSPADLTLIRNEMMKAIWAFFHPVDLWQEYAGKNSSEDTEDEREPSPETHNKGGEADG